MIIAEIVDRWANQVGQEADGFREVMRAAEILRGQNVAASVRVG